MMLLKSLSALFIGISLHASQGFFRESAIDPASPLAVLDPLNHPKIERIAKNLRFFSDLSSRPANHIYVHHQAIQNILVWPSSPLTALSWMLFPISPLPIINPNNIRTSDPLGKISPERLGQLLNVLSKYQEQDLHNLFYSHEQLQELYQIFVKPNEVAKFTANHKEEDLKAFYRYAIVDGVRQYVYRNHTPQDEYLYLTKERQAQCEASPHLFVIEVFKHSPSHLLEIPGTEILREPGETYFTEQELAANMQQKYGGFSYRSIEKFRIAATVDMLWKSAQQAPEQTLQLLSYYAWRKFNDQIFNVIMASGAVPPAQRRLLSQVLVNKFTKTDYQELVVQMQATEHIDDSMSNLTTGKQNLILYGSEQFSAFLACDYGNVRVKHNEQIITFANCAEQSLFNLTYLAQLQEQEIGIARNPKLLPEQSPLRSFWHSITDEDFNSTDTRNRWTQIICRLNGVVYRKGNLDRTPWTENHATAHWAELNPGVLNQMRALFHLLGQPNEASILTYENSTEELITTAALKISQRLSGTEEENPSFKITQKSEFKKVPGKKEWYGEFEITWHDEPLAVWSIEQNHSFLQITKKNNEPFSSSKKITNPYVIGQLRVKSFFIGTREEYQAQQEEISLSQNYFYQKLEYLKNDLCNFNLFFTHAHLLNEQFRHQLVNWCKDTKKSNFLSIAHKIMWGVAQINDGDEIGSMLWGAHPNFYDLFETQKLLSFSRPYHQGTHSQIFMNYKQSIHLKNITSLQPENRCQSLLFHITEASIPQEAYGWNISSQRGIEIFSTVNFSKLNSIVCSFDNDCSINNVDTIARLLPKNLTININSPITSDQLLALTNHINGDKTEYLLYTYNWHYNEDEKFNIEKAFNLLLPFAKSGKNFEPPFIEIYSNEDLEPAYEALRLVATIHKPMPLMLEDGEA